MSRPAARLGARLHREDGVSAVIVSVSLFAIFGAALLSVDAGSVWKTRRALVTDTDAAALAAARYLDAGGRAACDEARVSGMGSGTGQEASFVLARNDALAALKAVEVSPYKGDCADGAGHVRVDATRTARLAFGGLFGLDDVEAFSSSTAQYGPLATATGLRPIGICDKSPHFVEWKNYVNGTGPLGGGTGHPSYAGGGVVHRIYFQKGSSGCGTASGNWDWLDFNDNTSPNGNSALREWLLNGFGGVVSLGDEATGIPRDCNPDASGNQESCSPKTGAGGGSFEDSLVWLRDNTVTFPILVYDKVIDVRTPGGCSSSPPWDGSGSNARFCPAAFLLVRLHGWDKITGQVGEDSYFDLEFLDQWWVGQIGGDPAKGRPTAHGVQLCGGNYGTTIDQRCDV